MRRHSGRNLAARQIGDQLAGPVVTNLDRLIADRVATRLGFWNGQ